MKLSLNQRLHLRIFGHAFVETKPHPVTGKNIDYYVIRCEKHGLQVTYPSGHYLKLLCPECLKCLKEEQGILEEKCL